MFGVARGEIACIDGVFYQDPDERPISLEMAFVDASGAVIAGCSIPSPATTRKSLWSGLNKGSAGGSLENLDSSRNARSN
jgi:hypothetical protein